MTVKLAVSIPELAGMTTLSKDDADALRQLDPNKWYSLNADALVCVIIKGVSRESSGQVNGLIYDGTAVQTRVATECGPTIDVNPVDKSLYASGEGMQSITLPVKNGEQFLVHFTLYTTKPNIPDVTIEAVVL